MEENGWIIFAIIGVVAIIFVILNGSKDCKAYWKKLKVDELCNGITGINFDYLKTVLENAGFNIERFIQYSSNEFFVVDNNAKEFGITSYSFFSEGCCNSLMEMGKEELEQLKYNKKGLFEIAKPFINIDFKKRYKYTDLVKYEVVDKTKVKEERTFVQESNRSDVLTGALMGDALGNPINGAIVGAMVGNAGEKRVHEEVKTTTNTMFDIVVTLNKFDTPSVTITTTAENDVREIVGLLDYILNNK